MAVLSLQEILLGPTASPDHRVDALSLLRKLQDMEANMASGARVYYADTLSDLNAIVAPVTGANGFVLDDASPSNNGVYERGVSSWTKKAELPGAFTDSMGALDAVAALEGTLGDLATEDDIPASLINDSTTAGRALLTAADAGAQRTALSLVPGADVQAYDADLAAIAGLTSAANKLPYFTGSGTAALADLSSAGRALLDDANSDAQLTTLGGTAAGTALFKAADAGAQRTALELVPGTHVQAQDAGLQSIAGLTTVADRMIYTTDADTYAVAPLTSAGRALLDDANSDAQLTTLGGTAAGTALFKAADAGAQRTALDLDMLDTANDAVILGGETRLSDSDYRLVIEDADTGAVYAYIDNDGNAAGFGGGGEAAETDPLEWTKHSTDWSWFTSDVLVIIVGHGQSNARGQGTTATSTTPVYPGRALMPSNGPQVTGATGQALVDLVEVGTETPGSALVNNLIAKLEALTGSQPHVCYLNGAVSATPLRNLNRGSTAWTNIMGGIEDAVAWARTNGLTPVVLGMTWTQGEEGTDRPRTAAEYLADLDNLSRDFAADCRARTGQTYDPRIYATQIYSGHNNEPTDVQWAEWGPNLAAVEGHGRGLIRLAGPMYQLEIQTADYLHLTAAGQYAQGAMQAEAIYADWVGAGWSPIRPLRAWLRTPSIVRIEYAVPGGGDLEIVTGGAVTDTTNSTKGFQVFTAGRGTKLTISSVTVPAMTDVNDRYVDITLPAPVTGGVFVTYAMRRDTNGQNGPATGGRGCLATATTYTPLSGGAQRHWAAAHSITAGF